MIKAVIFDMDGTLLESMHVWDHVGEAYLTSLGIQPEKNLHEIMTPMSLPQSASYLKQTYFLKQDHEQIQKDIEACVLKYYQEDISLKVGASDCLERCMKQKLRICVLSASSKEMAEAVFKRHGILDCFEFIMTCEEAGYSKADVRIYQKTLDKLGLDKEECIFVDDALYAIACMKQYGCYVVAVYDKANDANWETICKISDENYQTLADWKGVK